MLDLHKKKNSMPPSSEREKIEREIAVTAEKIDEIAYRLYNPSQPPLTSRGGETTPSIPPYFKGGEKDSPS